MSFNLIQRHPGEAQRAPMSSLLAGRVLAGAIVLLAVAAMLVYGPIAQLADYHHFADRREWLGIAHVADVLSNLGFAVVGVYGLRLAWGARGHPAFERGRAGYVLFFASLLLTAFGSGWYHLAPDNARLVLDRLPIALACAGLLAAVWRETLGGGRWPVVALAAVAVASVGWWRYTDLQGSGDLRLYLLLQLLPLVLIPVLQWQQGWPRRERWAFGAALGLYLLAKACELADHSLFETLALVSGHTLKHLLASLAAAVVAWCLGRRPEGGQCRH
jgi:hypothetical protein